MMLLSYFRNVLYTGFVVFLMLLGLAGHSVSNASPIQSAPISVSMRALGEDSLVYWRPDGLWAINPITLEEIFVFEYAPPSDGYFNSMAIDWANNLFYVLEVSGLPHEWVNHGQIVQIDLSTGERTVIWQGPNLSIFNLSPDKTRMIVSSRLPYDNSHPKRWEVSYGYCLLTIASGECEDFTETISSEAFPHWLDHTHLYYKSEGGLFVADTGTLEWRFTTVEVEDWDFRYIKVLPERRVFSNTFRASDPEKRHFVVLDLDTLEITQFFAEPRDEGLGYLSPNEHYLIYGYETCGAGSGEQEFDVLNLQTGAYFTMSLTNFHCGITWFPNSQAALAIVTTYPDTDANESIIVDTNNSNTETQQNDIVYIDVLAKEWQVLGSYSTPLSQPVSIIQQR